MFVASDNPYQSPQVDDPSLEMGPPAKNGLLATAIFGVWAGVLFGGTFGLGGSLMLALSRGPLLGWDQLLPAIDTADGTGLIEHFLITSVQVAILGAVSGVVCGLLIGPFVGVLAAIHAGRFRKATVYTAIALSALAGGLIGHLACGQIVISPSTAESTMFIALISGTLIGGFMGLLGGRLLGRGILAFGSEGGEANETQI